MKLKNDRERNEFLTDHRNEKNGWYLWKQDKDLQRRWWRREFEGCAFVAEENLRTFTWPENAVRWLVLQWFIIDDLSGGKPFADGSASITEVRDKLKELTKSGKEI